DLGRKRCRRFARGRNCRRLGRDIRGNRGFGQFGRGRGLEQRRRFRFGSRSLLHKRRHEGFVGGSFDLEMERLFLLAASGCWLSVPPAHDRGIEPLLEYLAGAGLDDSLTAHHCGTMSLLVKIAPDPIDLILGEQTRLRVCVPKPEARTALENVIDRHAPFTGKSFDPLSRHLTYSIRALLFYLVAL